MSLNLDISKEHKDAILEYIYDKLDEEQLYSPFIDEELEKRIRHLCENVYERSAVWSSGLYLRVGERRADRPDGAELHQELRRADADTARPRDPLDPLIRPATNVQYANGRASQSAVVSGDFFTLLEYRKALRTLKDSNAEPGEGGRWPIVATPIPSSTSRATRTSRTSGPTVGPAVARAKSSTTPFRTSPLCASTSPRLPQSPRARVDTDYYTSWVVGKEAYGTVKMDKLPSEVIVHWPGSSVSR